MGGGGQTSTTVVQPSPMTPEQTALIGKQLELADRQLSAIDAQTPYTNALLAGATELLPIQLDVMKQTLASLNDPQQKALQQAQTQFALDTIPMQREILQQQLDTLKRNGAATPEQAKLIDDQTAAALASGTSDINAARDDALNSLKDFAASSGFTTRDSPILDRGNTVGREAVRQTGKLASDLAGANASAKLNFPLAAAGVQNALAGNTASITSAAQQFQQQLMAQANANRIQFASGLQSALGGAGAQGLGVATINSGLPASIGALNANRGQTSTTTTSGGGFNFGSLLGGLGGLASGIGALGGLPLFGAAGAAASAAGTSWR